MRSCTHRHRSQNPGQDTYASSVGVMGTSLDAIKLVMSSIISTKPWMRDPKVVSMPWNIGVEQTTLARAKPDGSARQGLHLKLGIFWSDGVVVPHPPVARGLRILNDLLKEKGHTVSISRGRFVCIEKSSGLTDVLSGCKLGATVALYGKTSSRKCTDPSQIPDFDR